MEENRKEYMQLVRSAHVHKRVTLQKGKMWKCWYCVVKQLRKFHWEQETACCWQLSHPGLLICAGYSEKAGGVLIADAENGLGEKQMPVKCFWAHNVF